MSSSYIGKVLDNYRIIENLGIGGMGVVFKAIHIKLDKLFALKMIAPGLTMNENFIKRFQSEAKALAKFEDPNIVRIYDLRADNDQWFIVMEYVDGITLLDKIKTDGAFKWQASLPILKQMLTGIGHAHSEGIIHRDLKPNNIMITNDHVVKITDFGLAKDQGNMITTMSLSSGGTLYYMSPEHVKGISFTDKRSDIYSIGMTFYEMIAGTVPFKDMESDFDIRETILRKDIAKPSEYNPEIPPLLEKIVMNSLAKDPNERYQTTDAMLEAIIEFEEKYPVVALGNEILPGPPTKKRDYSKINADDGPDTRFEKALKNQTRNFFKRYSILFAVLFLATVTIMIYALTSDSKKPLLHQSNTATLSFSSYPAGAAIYIEKDSVGSTPLDKYTLNSGSYKILLMKTGYHSIDTLITFKTDEKISLKFKLKLIEEIKNKQFQSARISKVNNMNKEVGSKTSLYADSDPPGADIWIDGKKMGKTPVQMDQLENKPYKIRIEKNGYSPYTHTIKPETGKTTKINPELSLLSGNLQITSVPESAIIKIDGEEIPGEQTPAQLSGVPVGNHFVEISKPGFSTIRKEVEIESDQITSLSFELVQLLGKLAVQVRPWGSIYLNNELQKASSDIKYLVELPVKKYELHVVHPTLGKWTSNIQVIADEEQKIIIDFNQKHKIQFNAVDESGNPLDAQIFIDEKDTGQATPAELQIRTGTHRVMVEKDGFVASRGDKEILIDKETKKSYQFVLKKIE